MSSSRLLFEIARWEFGRWFKFGDRLRSLVSSALIGLAVWGGLALVERFSRTEVTVVVFGTETLPLAAPEDALIQLEPAAGRSLDDLRKELAQQEIDAVLNLQTADAGQLLVTREPGYLTELTEILSLARRQVRLDELEINEEQLATLNRPYELSVESVAKGGRKTTADKIAAGVLIGLMTLGVFIGLSYQFVVITGEKRLRITEQIVSAVSPQSWIDGKILGLSALSMVSLLTYLAGTLIFLFVATLFGNPITIPSSAANPGLWLLLGLFSAGGFFLWNTLFAAFAATIDDPNTSARGSLMMLPFFPLALAFFVLKSPDAEIIRLLGLFPLTSPTVMAARLVLTQVTWWEILLSLGLLAATILVLRRVAGKIFALSILMYGKEPSWSEMARCLREA